MIINNFSYICKVKISFTLRLSALRFNINKKYIIMRQTVNVDMDLIRSLYEEAHKHLLEADFKLQEIALLISRNKID